MVSRRPAPSQRRCPRQPALTARAALRWAATGSLLLLAVLAGCTSSSTGTSHPAGTPAPAPAPGAVIAARPPPNRVCGQPILNSPYHYRGRPGKYSSGTPGLPTYGKPGSDFPEATAGVVLPAGKHSYLAYNLAPSTVYYLLPGTHIGSIQASAHDAFVGGFSNGQGTVLSGGYLGSSTAIDSNYSNGNQPGVTIEYLTIEKFQPNADGVAINQSGNTGWRFLYNTITLNVPGAGVLAAADNTLEGNCLTLNGQYGFQSSAVGPWGRDSLTDGPYNVTVRDNEISYNDTCDFEGTFDNPSIGWSKYNPVPERYRNPHCGKVVGDGNQGGAKLWQTNGVTIKGNYIHGNWGPGIWADTNNANTTYTGNVIVNNDGDAIIEEISYNFSITDNYLANNGWVNGLGNPQFPTPAIYISQSGSDSLFGGIPACQEASCARQPSYRNQSVISGNTLVNNGGNVFLWQNSDRFCTAGFDSACTLVAGGRSGPFTMSRCKSHLKSASVDLATFVGKRTGVPSLDWWDGCLWWTSNVSVTNNHIYFNPAQIMHCNQQDWPDCGAGGIFAEYGVAPPYNQPGGWVILTQVTFFQNNTFSNNFYNGPSTFFAWNQGNGNNPVSWSEWTGKVLEGNKCSSHDAHQSGACGGPFGQDSGSIYKGKPAASAITPGPATGGSDGG